MRLTPLRQELQLVKDVVIIDEHYELGFIWRLSTEIMKVMYYHRYRHHKNYYYVEMEAFELCN